MMIELYEPVLSPLFLARFPVAALDPQVTRLAYTSDPADGRPPERWVVAATGEAGLPRAHDLCVLEALVTFWSWHVEAHAASFALPASGLAALLGRRMGLPFSAAALRRALRRLSALTIVEAELDVPALATTPGEPTREAVHGEALLTWTQLDAHTDQGKGPVAWHPLLANTDQVCFGPWFHATLCRGDLRPFDAAPAMALLSPFGQVLCRMLDHRRALGQDWPIAWPDLLAQMGLAPDRWPAPTEELWWAVGLLSDAGLVRHGDQDETGAFGGFRFPPDIHGELRGELSRWLQPGVAEALLSQHGPEAAAEVLCACEGAVGGYDEALWAERYERALADGKLEALRLIAWCQALWPLDRWPASPLLAAA